MPGFPPAEVDGNAQLVGSLLREQKPELASLPVRLVAEGWDNFMFRVGSDWLMRLPRRAVSADSVLIEQRWLPLMAAGLSIPVPTPVHAGVPGCGYPWHWSLVPWLDGVCLDEAEGPCDVGQARRFARFLRELHQPAAPDAPHNPARGVPLTTLRERVGPRLARLRALDPSLSWPAIERIWEAGLVAPPTAAKVWLHGDLHALNVLSQRGKITAVIDWGDLCGGDPASDLACIWLLFEDAQARRSLIETYAVDDDLLLRSRAWGVVLGTALLESGLTNSPRHARLGAATLRRLADDVALRP